MTTLIFTCISSSPSDGLHNLAIFKTSLISLLPDFQTDEAICNIAEDQKLKIKNQLDRAINLIKLQHNLNDADLIFKRVNNQLVDCPASVAPPGSIGGSDGTPGSTSGPGGSGGGPPGGPLGGNNQGLTLIGFRGPSGYIDFIIWILSIISTMIFGSLWYRSSKQPSEVGATAPATVGV
jgi:hypothetical protein